MPTLFHRYQRRLQHRHGWQVELVCDRCGQQAVPQFRGWTPDGAIRWGKQSTIYANLSCPTCGKDLKQEAGQRLVGLFRDIPTARQNKRLLWGAVTFVALLPLLGMAAIWAGVRAGLWGGWAFSLLGLSALLITPATMWCNYRIASIRYRCPCGDPDYLFMGLLGRSYCYRCSTCGRRLRLRD